MPSVSLWLISRGIVMKFLVNTHKLIHNNDVTTPTRVPTTEELLEVHTKEYLESLNSSYTVAQITELAFIAMMPNFLGALKRERLRAQLY